MWYDKLELIDPLTTLVAAFAGAWAAFHFESRKRKAEENDRRRSAANRALYTLTNMWGVMYQYHEEVVRPDLDKSDAWLNMAATPPTRYGLTEFDAQGISYLLDVGEPQVYVEIMLEEQRSGAPCT